jgi:hypothetical protein
MVEVPQTYQDLKTHCTKDQDGRRQRVRWPGRRYCSVHGRKLDCTRFLTSYSVLYHDSDISLSFSQAVFIDD